MTPEEWAGIVERAGDDLALRVRTAGSPAALGSIIAEMSRDRRALIAVVEEMREHLDAIAAAASHQCCGYHSDAKP